MINNRYLISRCTIVEVVIFSKKKSSFFVGFKVKFNVLHRITIVLVLLVLYQSTEYLFQFLLKNKKKGYNIIKKKTKIFLLLL